MCSCENLTVSRITSILRRSTSNYKTREETAVEHIPHFFAKADFWGLFRRFIIKQHQEDHQEDYDYRRTTAEPSGLQQDDHQLRLQQKTIIWNTITLIRKTITTRNTLNIHQDHQLQLHQHGTSTAAHFNHYLWRSMPKVVIPAKHHRVVQRQKPAALTNVMCLWERLSHCQAEQSP